LIDKKSLFGTGIYKAGSLYVKANPDIVYGGADSWAKFGRLCYNVF